jgi:hypothetical protein
MSEDVSKEFLRKEMNLQRTFIAENQMTMQHEANHSKLNLEIPPKDLSFCE